MRGLRSLRDKTKFLNARYHAEINQTCCLAYVVDKALAALVKFKGLQKYITEQSLTLACKSEIKIQSDRFIWLIFILNKNNS